MQAALGITLEVLLVELVGQCLGVDGHWCNSLGAACAVSMQCVCVAKHCCHLGACSLTFGLALQMTYKRRRLLTIWHDLQNLRMADLTFIWGQELAGTWAPDGLLLILAECCVFALL